jgi:A/G-specific adenine glycosylase
MTRKNDKISAKLLSWYKENQRVLPWRGSRDAYKIWLSEVIMQQTRIAQGTPYYLKFIEKYPDVQALAAAPEQEILKLWQGLGYYSRARNLLKAAQQVVDEYGGVFPGTYEEIIKLKGIGAYTASAIGSMAFNKPYAAVDGNVYRVLARLYGITTPVNANGAAALFRKFADDLLDKKNPGDFNEAMMEFGATLCLPKNPVCSLCPVKTFCSAAKSNTQSVLPVKRPAAAVKIRHFHYLFIKDLEKERIYLKIRHPGDIWQGLYDLPLIERNDSGIPDEKEIEAYLNAGVSLIRPLKKISHKLTHQKLEIHFYEILLRQPASVLNGNAVVIHPEHIRQYPLPKPIEIFLNDYLCNSEKY